MFKTNILLALFAALSLNAQTVLFYTEDGKEIKNIKGYPLDSRMQISGGGHESWVVQGGYQFCPNGYIPAGALRVGNPQFIQAADGFLGFGKDEQRFDHAILFSDIDYMLPETESGKPLRVVLNSGERGFLFVQGNFLQLMNDPKIPAEDRRIVVYFYKQNSGRKDDISRSGIRARAIAFNELGVRHAQDNDFQR